MPFSSISGVLSSNCERLAITLGNETRLRLIWLLTATNGKSGRAGSMGFISFLGWQRAGKFAVMTKETAGMPALEIFAR
jgi:hypothetical protein